MVSKNAKLWLKVILLVVALMGIFFVCLFLFSGNNDVEDDRTNYIVSIAAVAIDQNVPGADYDMVNAFVLENQDNTATVHMSGSIDSAPCRFSVMMESADPEDVKSYSVYYVAAGDTVFFFERVESTVKTPEDDPLKQSIREYLEKTYEDYNIDSLKIQNQKLELSIIISGASIDAPPENWEDIKTSFLEMSNSISSEFSSDTVKNFIIYGDDSSENHLVTITNGRIVYEAFSGSSSTGANPPTISLAEFNAISTGMTYQEVTDIIGSAGEVTSEVDIFDDFEYFTQARTWEGEGSLGANAVIEFQGGKVISKAQFGLE